MARRKLTNAELMSATEVLLLERGYDGFHFKLLAERLNVGRSTIYEYYASKDALIVSYMDIVMRKLFSECEGLASISSPTERLRALLRVLMKYTQIHLIIKTVPQIARDASPSVRKSIELLRQYHDRMFADLQDLVEAAKTADEMRQDVPSPVIADLFFHAILIKNTPGLDYQSWGDLLFDVMLNGVGKNHN